MSNSDPNVGTQWTYQEQWQSDIENAYKGDTQATRALIGTCIRFLRSKRFPVRVKLRDNKTIETRLRDHGYLPEPFCSFLINTLEKALSVDSKDVGKAMGIGSPTNKDSKYQKDLSTFRNHFNFIMFKHEKDPEDHQFAEEDIELTERNVRAMVLEEIASLMNVDLRTVQRYYKDAGVAGAGDLGDPEDPEKSWYDYEYDPYEDEDE